MLRRTRGGRLEIILPLSPDQEAALRRRIERDAACRRRRLELQWETGLSLGPAQPENATEENKDG